jgi:hypothetical protein
VGYPPGYATPPGWYPDPWYPQSTRYWDGATWTEHAQWAGWRPWVDPTSVRKWGARAGVAFLLEAGAGALTSLTGPVIYGSFFDNAFTSFESGDQPNGLDGSYLAGNLLLQVAGLASIAVLIFLAVWGNHITTTARTLGLRTTHSPGWAVAGWLVPIINLWFPYQVVRDALPPGHPSRGRVAWWWGLRVTTTVLTIVAMLFAFASPGAGAAVGLCAAAAFLGAAYLAHDLATALGEAHEQILQRVTGVTRGAPL